ncbi:hypothetical protein BH11PSE3_BH11PSE3_33910 [soil metagenome]
MMTYMKGLLTVVAISLPGAAFAQQMSDTAYCGALVTKYEKYLDMSAKRGRQPQSLDARMSVEQCRAGNAAGIPGIETALRDAGYTLPSRTATAVSATTTKAANCGMETWSTDKMAYVGVPCASDTTEENPGGASK